MFNYMIWKREEKCCCIQPRYLYVCMLYTVSNDCSEQINLCFVGTSISTNNGDCYCYPT